MIVVQLVGTELKIYMSDRTSMYTLVLSDFKLGYVPTFTKNNSEFRKLLTNENRSPWRGHPVYIYIFVGAFL